MRLLASAALIVASLACAPPTHAASGGAMPAPIVFFDIAGPDAARQTAFYRAVFGWDVGPAGQFTVSVPAAGLPATLRADPADKVIYAGVDDVTAALAKVTANGGSVVQPRLVVKGVVVLGLFKDPAGNTMGVVEIKDGKPVVP